ncbi:MAG: AMP-binding protein, partial [Paracoccaceae bacterium]
MIEDREIGIRVPTKEELVELAASILQSPVDPEKKLVSQGLDSLGASELLEVLHQRGLDVDYEFLLSQASIDSLLEVLHAKVEDGPRLSPQEWAYAPFSLTGPQEIWAGLEDQGWGSWANISLCLSIPASVIRATYLPAIVQSLCDANDAMRMVLVKSQDDGAKVRQRRVPDFQIPVHVRDAPDAKRDAMRLIEAFEGEECTPFSPSTRALVLSSPNNNGRHWLCITMHHVFADRISMQNLERQFRDILSRGALEFDQSQVVAFSDVARWQTDKLDQAEGQHCQALRALLGGTDVSANRQKLRLCENLSTGSADSPTKAHFSYAQVKALEAHASELETTLPLFIHAVYSALLPQLTGDDKSLRGEEDLLLCQVVSNRERHTTLKHLVGCMDTSVPVAVSLSGDETLASLCKKTQKSFVAAHRCIADLPRGGWLDASEATLFERVPHINIVRAAPSSPSENAPLNIQEHSVDRVQKTRWGLLLRVALPLSEGNADANDSAQEMTIRAFAEDRELAGLASQCLADVLHAILAEPVQTAGELRILETVERIVEHARFAVDQIRQASAMMSNEYKADAFIYDKLIARQQRWFAHNAQHELCRDASNRFVGTVANPFPFTQLDKLKERRFLEERGIPLPKMLHVIPKENLRKNLIKLAPSLPPHFAIKPVGAGHSFGVTLVRDNLNLSQDGIPFDAKSVAAKLHDMAEQGHCIHAGNAFPFNFSSFLIEELVLDEKGFAIPTDYKVFMIGKTFLWLQLHFKKDDVNWVAFVDADFKLLPEPAWDPATCWQTHKALVCIDQREIDARKPKCLPDILNHSHRLASDMDIFVRLDWYSDKNHGALMGEITTFPHMLQPRSFYTPWANKLVKSLWQDPDGVALKTADVTGPYISDPIAQAEVLINEVGAKTPHLEDFIPKTSKALWAVEENVTFKALHAYVSGFDLARFGTSHGERVGLLVANGAQLGALLLATMNRYIAVPIGSTLPASLIAAQVENCAIKTLVVVGGSDEAKKAQDIARDNCGLTLVELAPNSFFALAELPPEAPVGPAARSTAKNGLDDDVLLLQSSGSTGDPKRVAFTLSRLMRSGTMIAKSLDLSPADQGVSMLPLHHIAGIACNLVAPLLSSGSMRFERSFDPKLYITALSGPTGATWSFLVPSMWALLTEYAKSHPELKATRPWPRLRLLRSAGSELSHDTAKELSALFGDTVAVLPTYGMTEAMPIASPCSTYHLKCPGSVGQVLPDVSVEIIDTDHGSFLSVADGIVGEITVKGATVIESYDGAEHTPSSTFTARGYFRTGDLGAFAADGSKWLSIKGRIKDVINVGGETIAPADVEAVLRNCPVFADQAAHVQIMAFARPHSDLGECVAIAIVGADADLDVTRVHAWAEKHLSPAMVPVSFVLLSKFPQTETGKLKRAQFAEQFNAHHSATKLGTLQTYSWLAHETSPKLCTENTTECQRSQVTTHSVTLDQVVAVIQGQVKSQTEIGPDTRLDDAGVNSLAAVHLSNALNDYFQVDLPTWAISDHPTPRALFAWIENSKSGGISVSRDIKTMSAPRKITQPNGSTLRMLFLHGEAADAELMEMSLQATQWSGRLKDKLDFVCVNAPHARKPAPEFHTAALDAGLYEKSEYKSWGVSDPELLEQSISNVLDTLEGHGTINAIGGICDGALVASIVASRRPELKLLLCMSPSPVSRLA